MNDELITKTIISLFDGEVSQGQKTAVINEFEMMGNAGEYPISHYVKMYLPENLKDKWEQATQILES